MIEELWISLRSIIYNITPTQQIGVMHIKKEAMNRRMFTPPFKLSIKIKPILRP